jgi:hypothetical protein
MQSSVMTRTTLSHASQNKNQKAHNKPFQPTGNNRFLVSVSGLWPGG